MKHCLFLFLWTALLTGCAAVNSVSVFNDKQARIVAMAVLEKPARQQISIMVPKRFSMIDIHAMKIGTTSILIPKSQSLYHWQESFQTTIKSYQRYKNFSPKRYLAHYLKQLRKQCKAVQVEILLEKERYILYSFKVQHCKALSDLIQIGKLFKGDDAIYGVMYNAKCVVSHTQIEQGLKSIQSALLINNPNFWKM